MSDTRVRRRIARRVLIVLLIVAVLVLGVVVAVLVPILTHESAGDSGQQLPEDFVSQTSATGADGRMRTLSVETTSGGRANLAQLTPGEELIVRGSGFDPSIGLYVSICLVPSQAGERPSPCLGGLPEGAMTGEAAASKEATSSAWITDDWAWRAFATKGFDDPKSGDFEVKLLVPQPIQEGLDCTQTACVIATRADHTASNDRVQDMLLPVAFES